jgi:HD-like signal output (HDOD) protein
MGLWQDFWQKLAGEPARYSSKPPARPSGGVRGGIATLDLPAATNSSTDEVAAVPPWWSPPAATLIEPEEIPRPDLSPEARALENLLVSHFDGHDLTLPPLLGVAERVLRRIHDKKSDLAQVAKEIESDQVIAAAILRMANSPLYRGLHKITALPAAVNRLGLVAIRTLMVRESMRAALFGRKGAGDPFARLIWRRSLAGAFIMRRLSAFTNLRGDDAYLMGLLHDIGNIIVLRILQSQPAAVRRSIDLLTFEYLCMECHQEFGELIAEEWKLPASLKSIIADHHSHPAAEDPLRTERLQLMLANMTTAMTGYAPQASYDLRNARVVADLGLTDRDDFLMCLTILPDELQEMLDAG